MLGFMRRYDHSYQVAKKKMENGDIGDVILVRCYSQDPISIIEGTLEYAPRSGGQFIDMSIHDFDLIRWLTGSEPKKLWAIGGCYEFKQYKDWDDGDNVSGLMQMENDAMAFFFAAALRRTARMSRPRSSAPAAPCASPPSRPIRSLRS